MIYILPGATDTLAPFALFDNKFSEGALTAYNTPAESAAENMLGPQTYDYWRSSVVPAVATVVLAAPAPSDCFAFAAHDLGSKNAQVNIYYSPTDVAGWYEITTIYPVDDKPFAVLFPSITAQRWRVRIGTADAPPSIGICYVGKRLVFPADVAPPYVTAPHAARVENFPSLSAGGQLLGVRQKRKAGEMSVNFSPIARAFIEGDMAMFRARYDDGLPFFWAASPGKYPDDLSFAWRPDGGGELRPAYDAGGRNAQISMSLQTYGA